MLSANYTVITRFTNLEPTSSPDIFLKGRFFWFAKNTGQNVISAAVTRIYQYGTLIGENVMGGQIYKNINPSQSYLSPLFEALPDESYHLLVYCLRGECRGIGIIAESSLYDFFKTF